MEKKIIVTVKQGKLCGRIAKDRQGSDYYSFQGIPYAKPPLGELRFKAPHEADCWEGIKDATKEGNVCFSRDLLDSSIIGSEDCLFLNVYTPELPASNSTLKPVMVWIHGGAFTHGSGNTDFYGPEFLITHDVILVTINYRLGFFGFLNFDDPSLNIPGNAGLKDQVMALRWVKENITAFNGDYNNVTIFGQSAGGASCHFLVLSPLASGLFHKAIIQSGTANSFWSRGRKSFPYLAKHLGLETENEILKGLESMSSLEILELQFKSLEPFEPRQERLIGAVVERTGDSIGFLTEEPEILIKSGRYNNVTMIFGYCNREGIISEAMGTFGHKKASVADLERCIPHFWNIGLPNDKSKQIALKIKEFYYGDNEPSETTMDVHYLIETDSLNLKHVVNAIKFHLEKSSNLIYLYRFSLESTLNIFKNMTGVKLPGVSHGDDLGYLFKNSGTPIIRPNSIEDEGIYKTTKLWTNFARFGNPTPAGNTDPLIGLEWKPAIKNTLHFIDIGENLTVGVNPEYSRMKFWDELHQLALSKAT